MFQIDLNRLLTNFAVVINIFKYRINLANNGPTYIETDFNSFIENIGTSKMSGNSI